MTPFFDTIVRKWAPTHALIDPRRQMVGSHPQTLFLSTIYCPCGTHAIHTCAPLRYSAPPACGTAKTNKVHLGRVAQIVRVNVVSQFRSPSHLRQCAAERLGVKRSSPGGRKHEVVRVGMRRCLAVPSLLTRPRSLYEAILRFAVNAKVLSKVVREIDVPHARFCLGARGCVAVTLLAHREVRRAGCAIENHVLPP